MVCFFPHPVIKQCRTIVFEVMVIAPPVKMKLGTYHTRIVGTFSCFDRQASAHLCWTIYNIQASTILDVRFGTHLNLVVIVVVVMMVHMKFGILDLVQVRKLFSIGAHFEYKWTD